MQGYWARPEATEECLQNGRFLTGDIGVMDADGYTYIVDRKKDVIVTNNGFNVYPRDIEEILFSHQAIAECAICGVPDSKRGETILAAVVLHEGASLSADEVTAYLKGRIVDYMMPERIEFMAELPKSQVGKILKKDIREIYAA
jgi:long-chain acyl-CoA synthetase